MNTEQAVPEASATSQNATQDTQAAETVESATTGQQESQETETPQTTETTEQTGSEPKREGELGEKGNREIRSLRKRTQLAEREAAYQKGRADTLAEVVSKSGKSEAQPTQNELESQFAQQKPKPQADQFESVAEFHEALTDWKLDYRDWKQEQGTKKTQETTIQSELSERMEAQRTRGEEKYEDFEDTIKATGYSTPMMSAMAASNIGEDIAYFLAKNPAELSRITKLSPFLQSKEIGRIELALETGKIQIKKTTTAPAPPRTVGGTTANATQVSYFDEKLSTEDRIKMSRTRKAAAQGR